MERMNKKAEQQLIKSVESVIALTNSGTAPTVALEKVARDNNYAPQEISRIAEAYNQSRTLHHLSEKKGEARLELFDLADPSSVSKAMYPDTYKMKGDINKSELAKQAYARPVLSRPISESRYKANIIKESASSFVKSAAIVEAEPVVSINESKRDYELLRSEAGQASIELESQLTKLAENLQDSFGATPFHKLEVGLHHKFGSNGGSVADFLFSLSDAGTHGQRRANARELDYSNNPLFDYSGDSYASVEKLVSAATDLHKKAATLYKKKKQLELMKQAAVEGQGSHSENPFDKYALFDAAQSVIGGIKDQLASISPTVAKREALEEAVSDLDDPIHRDKIKQVKVQAILSDLMTNDPVISTHDPQEVLDMYNQIVDLSPAVADRPAIIKGWLRQGLEIGNIPAFEAGSIVSQGNQLADSGEYRRKGKLENLLADPTQMSREIKAKEMEARNKAAGPNKPSVPPLFNTASNLAAGAGNAVHNTFNWLKNQYGFDEDLHTGEKQKK